MFVYAKGTVTSRKKEEGEEEEEEEEREEEELDDKLGYPVDEAVTAHIFAMVCCSLFEFPLSSFVFLSFFLIQYQLKRDLFGDSAAEVSLISNFRFFFLFYIFFDF